ncbi:hypothetical protein [Streptomyces goshikiensis]|uniref:hypothetical protein n=1 Tax=Streptomyces goshikiensis TaxID=1942 RepID=UPI00365040DA
MTASGWPLVTLFHAHAHPQNTVTEAAMTAIASRLGLLHVLGFRRRGELVYDIRGVWRLDYGHPRDALRFLPGTVCGSSPRGAAVYWSPSAWSTSRARRMSGC